MTQQKEKKPDQLRVHDEQLEEALEESFPASDPPSMTQPKPRPDQTKKDRPPVKSRVEDEDDDPTRVDRYEDEDK